MKQKLYPLLVAVLVVGFLMATSCKKQEERRSEARTFSKAIAVYEQQYANFPMTKSANIHEVVKPLPGDFTPIWERAVEKQDGDVVATTAPFSARIQYQAVYPCDNRQNEHAEHSHEAIPVVQKMVVIINSDSAACYIVNIVPYEDCGLEKEEIEANFVYGDGLNGFSGFAAYHNFDGSVVFVDQYVGGARVQSSGRENGALISEITRGVKLYNNPDEIDADYSGVTKITEALSATFPSAKCFCNNDECRHPLVVFMHCVNCLQSYEQCSCYGGSKGRCEYCGGLLDTDIPQQRKCNCPDWRIFHDYPKCITCGAMNCYMSHKNNSSSPTCLACGDASCHNKLIANGKHVAHADIIRTIFKSVLSFDNLHKLQEGCHSADCYYNLERDAHVHGVTDKFYDVDVQVDYAKLKSFFISNVKSFKNSNNYGDLGRAFHPLFDSYLSVQNRVEFSFEYYSYDRPAAIISEKHLLFDMTASVYCVRNMLRLHNLILSMPSNTSDEQFGALLDAWRYSHSEEAEIQ